MGSISVNHDKGLLKIYALAYMAILCSVSLVWLKHPEFLYMGRDADLALWISNTYRTWANAYDLTAINPFQGMTSTLVTINPHFNPGEWVFWTTLPYGIKLIVSFIVYFIEVTFSTFVLGLVLGFSRQFSFAASIWVMLLLFPPFNFMFGLQGWLATAPLYGHSLALSNLILVAFVKIGDAKWSLSGSTKAASINWLLATCMFILVLLSLFAAPFYNAGMLIGLALASGIIFLSSVSLQQFAWRSLTGLYIVLLGYLFGFLEFYSTAHSYSVRFAKPVPIANAKLTLCNWGLVCDSFPGFPWALSSSHWLHVAIIGGGVALWARLPQLPRPLPRIGLCCASTWVALLTWWGLGSLDIVTTSSFSPLYFFLMLFPFLAFLSLYAVCFLPSLALPSSPSPQTKFAVEAAVSIGIAILIVAMALWMGVRSANLDRTLPHLYERKSTSITDILRREIALQPGDLYRGSVATVLGEPDGVLRPFAGLSAREPMRAWQFEKFLQLVAESGNSHDLLDLWRWGVPTLSEYGQGVSRPLMFYMSNFLSSPGDDTDLNFALPHAINIDVMRAMGVRFIITDAEVSANGVSKRHILPLKQHIDLKLYEIADPNTGTYSPVTLQIIRTANEFAGHVKQNPTILRTHAFVNSPGNYKLVPARNSKMAFEKNGVHIKASSDSASALLLPIQFSNCYHFNGSSTGKATLLRANIIHTLVVFEGELDAHLRWEYGFLGKSKCRTKDIAELTSLGLGQKANKLTAIGHHED